MTRRSHVPHCVLAITALSTILIGRESRADFYSDAIRASSPVGYYRLNETSGTAAIDSSGNGNHGIYVGGYTQGVAGAIAGDSAAAFDGTSGYVSLPQTWGGGAAITVEAWVKVVALTGDYHAIVSAQNQSFVHFQLFSSGSNVVYGNGGAAILPFISDAPSAAYRYIALTSQSGNSQLYVDGVAFGGSDSTTYANILSASGIRIGSGYDGGRFFNGSIDEVAIYDRALSSSEILAHFNAASAVPEPSSLILAGIGGLLACGVSVCRRRSSARP